MKTTNYVKVKELKNRKFINHQLRREMKPIILTVTRFWR